MVKKKECLKWWNPFCLFLQLHLAEWIASMSCPSLRCPAWTGDASSQSVEKGTRRGYLPGAEYWAVTRLCQVLIPGWRPFILTSWTSAPAPWCPPAGSYLPLTASSASTIKSCAVFVFILLSVFIPELAWVTAAFAVVPFPWMVLLRGGSNLRRGIMRWLWPPFTNTLYLTKRLVQGKLKQASHRLWFPFDVNKRESAVG